MDSTFNVPDPSDWLQTTVPLLGPVDSALRCQVCKDFFNTPMITSCSHTFCSLCIRRCLTTDGRCPSCRAQDQEIKLRPNPIVQDLVDSFQAARPVVLQLVKDGEATGVCDAHGKRKRKLADTDINEDESCERPEHVNRRTESQHGKYPHESNVGGGFNDNQDDDLELNEGLIACPICSARMKEEAVFSHLDTHNGSDDALQAYSAPAGTSHFSNSMLNPRPPPIAMERLPQLNYSLLKENALRRKLSEIGIPNGGLRPLLIRRHTEWVNLVNANCDSNRPRTKRELLHELDVWDRTQGRQILNHSTGASIASSVMNKDFDGAAWAASHDRDFQSLIAKARRRVNPNFGDANSTDGPSLNVHEDSNGNPGPTTNVASERLQRSGSSEPLHSTRFVDLT